MKSPSEKTPLLVDEEKGLVPAAQPQDKSAQQKIQPGTLIGKFCNNGDVDPAFGEHIEIALRVVFAVIVFIAFQVDPAPEKRPWAGSEYLDLIHPLSMTMLFFSIGKTTGAAINNVWCGMFGTFIATLAIWIMFGVFPGGYYGEKCPDHVFWSGVVAGCIFVITILWVNLDCNTKIFALCNWVWFWMDFLHHGSVNTHNQGFELNFHGSFMLAFARCGFGCGLAIVIALLPYPILASSKAKQIAKTVAADACTVWEDATKSYWADGEGQVYEFDRLLHEIYSLQSALSAMGSMNGQSWWECLGMGAVGRSRGYLDLLTATLVKNLDRLPCVLKSCSKNAGESSPEEVANHRRVADIVLPPIKQVVATTGVLLKLCVEVSCDGEVDDNERAMLVENMEAVKKALNSLRVAVISKRPNTGTSEKVFDVEYLDEYTFCYCVSHFGRNTADFAKAILDMQDQPRPSMAQSILALPTNKIKSIFDSSTLQDAETKRFVLRNGAGILTAFYLGYRGFPLKLSGMNSSDLLLSPISAGAASTLTMMLTKFTGSAMQSTLSRIMGMILGVVCGMMMVGVFSENLISLLLVVAIWVGGTIFMYLHSTGNAGTFLLMCILGVNGLLHRCPKGGCHWDERKIGAMNPIIDCMFALLVMIVVDLVLRPRPASEQAGEMLLTTWSQLTYKVEHLFDKEQVQTHEKQANITANIATCQALGHEASNEPTYWRSPWKGSLYGRVAAGLQDLRFSILCMNCSADAKGDHGNAKSDFFLKTCHVPAFEAISSKLLERMKAMETFLPVFTYESQSRFPPLSNPASLANFTAEEEKLIDAFVELVNKKENQWMLTESQQDDGTISLEQDPICKFSILILCIHGLMEDMREMQHDILRSA